MLIPRSEPWSSQPQYPVRAKAGNPIWLGSANDIGGQLPESDTSSKAGGLSLTGRDYSGTAVTIFGQQAALSADLVTAAGMTCAVLFDVDALTNYGHLVGNQTASTGGVVLELRLGVAATDSKINVVRSNNSAAYKSFDTGANRYAAGDRAQLLVVTFADNLMQTAPTVWAKGIKYATSSNGGSGSGAVAYDANAKLRLGRRVDGATQLDGRIYAVEFWPYALSDSEVDALYDNFWSSLAPRDELIFIPDAVASGSADANSSGLATVAAAGASTAAAASNVSAASSVAMAGSSIAASSINVGGSSVASIAGAAIDGGAVSAAGASTVNVEGTTAESTLAAASASGKSAVSMEGNAISASATMTSGQAVVTAAGASTAAGTVFAQGVSAALGSSKEGDARSKAFLTWGSRVRQARRKQEAQDERDIAFIMGRILPIIDKQLRI